MSSAIEQKILEMRFDNKQFEDNVNESINTLGKLRQSLNFDGVEKNFDALSSASNGIDFSPLREKLTSVGQHINSVFREIGIGALRDFGASIERDVISKIKDITFGQFNAGWDKYNEKVESVQTIMAATGLTIEEVNEQLTRLNWFSDETSYSFTDMTSNVAKFTGAGVELNDAVEAMQGISTWAALAGQKSSTAARAMYNLSQAMGMGYVSLGDWRSIEMANMGMESFKEVVLDVAAAHGTLQKYSDGTYQVIKANGEAIDVTAENMRNTLSEKWFTKEVLLDTLQIYGNFANRLAEVSDEIGISATDFMTALDVYDGSAESLAETCDDIGISAETLIPYLDELSSSEYELGRKAFKAAQEAKTFGDAIDATKDAISTQWMNTFEYLFGNYEQAKKFFTGMTNIFWDIFATSGDIRNEILKEWSKVGGEVFRGGLLNVLQGISNIVEFIRSTITDVLGITGMAFDKNGEAIEKTAIFTEKLVGITERFGTWAKTFADFTSDLNENLNIGDEFYVGLSKTFDTFGKVLGVVWSIVKSLTPLFVDLFSVLQNGFEFLLRWGVIPLLDLIGLFADFIKQNQIVEKSIGGVTKVLKPLFDLINSGIIFVHNFLVELSGIISETKIFKNIFEGVSLLFSPLIEKVKTFFSLFKSKINLPKFEYNFGEIFDIKAIQNFSDKIIPFFQNLKDKLSNVWEFFKDIFSKITGVISPVIEKIKSLFVSINEKADFSQFTSFHDILEKIKNKLEPVSTFLSDIFNKIKDFFANFDLGEKLSKVWEFISNISKTVWNFVSEIDFSAFFKNLMSNIENFGKNIGDWLGKLFKGIADGISAFLTGVSDNSGSSFSGLFRNLVGGFIIFKGLGSDGEKSGNILQKIFSPLTSLFESLKEKIDSFIEETDEGKLKDIAVSILMLAAALAVIASIDQDRLGDAFFTMGTALGGLTLAMGKMSKFEESQGKGMKAAGMAMVELSASLLILSIAAKSFNSVEWGDLGKMAATLAGVLVAFGAIGYVSKKTDMKDLADKMKTFSESAVILGIAFKVLAWAAKDFNKVKWGDLGKMGAVLAALVAALKIVSKFYKDITENTKGIIQLSEALVILGVGFKVIASAGKDFTEVDWTSLAKMGSVLVVFTAYIDVLSRIFKKLETNIGSILAGSAALAVLAIGMDLMAKAAVSFNKVEWGSLAQMGVALLAFTAFIALLKLIKTESTTMLAAVVAFGLMGPAMTLFSKGLIDFCLALKMMSDYIVDINLNGLTTIAFVLAGLVVLMNSAVPAMTAIGVMLFNIGSGVALVGAGVALIGAGVLMIGTGIAALNLAFLINQIGEIGRGLKGIFNGVAFNIFLQNIKQVFTLIPDLISLTLVGIVKGVGDVLSSLGDLLIKIVKMISEIVPEITSLLLDMFVETAKQLSDGLGEIVPIIMDIVLKLLDYLIEYIEPVVEKLVIILCKIFDSLKEHIPTLLTSFMGFISALVGEIIKIAENTGQDTLLKIAEMFLGVVAVIVVLNLIKSMIPGAMVAVAEVAVLIAKIGGIVALFGMINSIPGVQGLVEKGGDLLEAIGTAVGKFVGGFVSGGLESATSSLPKVGENIAKFWENIKPFIDGVSAMSAEAAVKVAVLTGCITALTASDLLGGVADFMRDKLALPEFGVSISKLWTNIQPFIEGVSTLKKSTVESASLLSDTILKLTAGELLSGITSFIFGKEDINKFGESIGALGPHIATFSDSVKNISIDAVKTASEALGILAEAFSDNTFKTGGLVQWFTGGTTDLKKFGESIAALGPYMVDYSNSVKDLTIANVVPATKAITEIVSAFDNDVFRTGGVMQWFKGENGIEDFGKALKSLGPNLRDYSIAVAGINVERFRISALAIDEIMKIAENFTGSSWSDRLFGIDKVAEFTGSISQIGIALKGYYENIAAINVSQMTAMTAATQEVFRLFSGETGVTFKIDKDFKQAMRDIASSGISEFLASFSESVTKVRNAGEEFIETFTSGISTSTETIKISFDEFFIYCTDKFNTAYGEFKDAGIKLMTNLSDGIKSVITTARQSANLIISVILTQFTSYSLRTSFKVAGENLMTNVSNGIKALSATVASAAESVAQKAYEKMIDEKLLSSFIEAGKMLADKYAEGIEDQTEVVETVVQAMVDKANKKMNDGMEEILKDIHSYMNENFDFKPVITPTFDTSELNAILTEYQNRFDTLIASATSRLAEGLNTHDTSTAYSRMASDSHNDPYGEMANSYTYYNFYGDNIGSTSDDIAKSLRSQIDKKMRSSGIYLY